MLTREFVKNIKKNFSKLNIPIQDDDSHCVGQLILITEEDVRNKVIIDSLTRWRMKFMKYFLTQFTASAERTRSWLANTVIPSEDRLLFLIVDETERLIGNFGIANIEHERCELDNLIRGEKGGHHRLIYFSEISLLKWLYYEQSMRYVNLHVFSNNTPTIKLHSSVGFKEIARKPLYKFIHTDGTVSYRTEYHECAVEVVPFEYVEMGLDVVSFESLHAKKETI